jgi:AraC-like DNA-binding protein
MVIVAFQTELRPELPEINGSKDYREFRATLEDMDRILVKSGIEHRFISKHIEKLGLKPNTGKYQFHCRASRMALRYCILLALTNESYRELSRHVADRVIVRGKSVAEVERLFIKWVGRTPAAEIRRVQLERTRQMLEDTSMPISDIAATCGWKYVEHMIPVSVGAGDCQPEPGNQPGRFQYYCRFF